MAPRQSYGSIAIKHEEELENLVPQPTETQTTGNKKKHGVFAVLAIVTLATIGVTLSHTGDAADPPSPSGHKHYVPGKSVDEDDGIILSDQSPVDLGFKSIVRASDAVPSTIWGNRTGPLPTNSWYLVSVPSWWVVWPVYSTTKQTLT